MIKQNYVFRAVPDHFSRHYLGVIDGDTVDLIIDLGFNVKKSVRIRVLDLDTPEIRGKNSSRKGMEAKLDAISFFQNVIDENPNERFPLLVETTLDRTFDRYLGRIIRVDRQMDFQKFMISKGWNEYKRK